MPSKGQASHLKFNFVCLVAFVIFTFLFYIDSSILKKLNNNKIAKVTQYPLPKTGIWNKFPPYIEPSATCAVSGSEFRVLCGFFLTIFVPPQRSMPVRRNQKKMSIS